MAIKREEKTEPVKTSFIDLEKADRGFVELMLWLDDKGYDFNERVFLLDQAKTFTIMAITLPKNKNDEQEN